MKKILNLVLIFVIALITTLIFGGCNTAQDISNTSTVAEENCTNQNDPNCNLMMPPKFSGFDLKNFADIEKVNIRQYIEETLKSSDEFNLLSDYMASHYSFSFDEAKYIEATSDKDLAYFWGISYTYFNRENKEYVLLTAFFKAVPDDGVSKNYFYITETTKDGTKLIYVDNGKLVKRDKHGNVEPIN